MMLFDYEADNHPEIEENEFNTGMVVIFNRVPKCGTTTMEFILRKLSIKNKFNLVFSRVHGEEIVEQSDFISSLLGMSLIYNKAGEETGAIRDTVYVKTQHYVPIPKFLSQNTTYINLIRDPAKRFISGYYFRRKGINKIISSMNERLWIPTSYLSYLYKSINKTWLDENLTEEAKQIYFIKDNNTVQNFYDRSKEWLNKPLSKCISNISDEECHDFSGNRPLKITPREALIKFHAGESNLLLKEPSPNSPFLFDSAVPYFCGTENFCRDINYNEALNQAIKNIDTKFQVIGVLEQLERTLIVLEDKLPRFFSGALEEYEYLVKNGQEHQNKMTYELPPDEDLGVMKNNLMGEYKLYEHAKKKLEKQYYDTKKETKYFA